MPRLLCIEIFLPTTYSLREHSLVWGSRTQKGSEDFGVSKVVLEIEKEWNLILKKKKKEWEKWRPPAKEIILQKEDGHLPPSASALLPFLFERTYLLFLHQSKTRVLNLGKEIKMWGRIGANHWISTNTIYLSKGANYLAILTTLW